MSDEPRPIIQNIEVPCPPQRAFDIFLRDMSGWWPLRRFSVSALRGETAAGLRVEARLGGTIVELGPDGREHLWGTITTFEPPAFLRMDFHITQSSAASTILELRFAPLGINRTRVTLIQRNWQAFGPDAKLLYGGYAQGWAIIFQRAYRAACGAAPDPVD